MTLKTQMAADLSAFFNSDDFAESVIYSGTVIPAIVELEGDQQMPEPTEKTATLFVKVSSVAAPAYRDAVVIGGATWNVIQIPGKDEEGVWKLGIERAVKVSFKE